MQETGQQVRPPVQLPVAVGALTLDDGELVRIRLDLLTDQVENRLVRRDRNSRPVPRLGNPPALFVVQNVQTQHRLLGLSHGQLEQPHEMPDHATDRLVVEEIRVVLESTGETLAFLHHEQRQIELGRPAVGLYGFQNQVNGNLLRPEGSVLQSEHHLEERAVAHVALGLQHLDELLERHVLVSVSSQRHFPHPPDQFGKAGIARQIRPQHQSVDEKADQAFDFRPVAVGDGRAHQNVALARVPGQQCVEGRQQSHEQGGVVRLAELADRFGQFR